MSRALKNTLNARGADLRLLLKDALAGLEKRELQAQAVFTVEHLLQRAEPQQADAFLRDLFTGLKDCPPAVRRLRYRLGAYALRLHAGKQWGQALLFVRDRAVERVGHEGSAEAAAELAGAVRQLAGACIEAYCRGQFSALGVGSKEELRREWLCELLITPLLRAACRAPAKAKLGNACLLVEGVLAQFRRWAKSSAVLYSATECLKEMLRLAGVVALTAGEAFLPIQSCVVLLGQRLTGAAVGGIFRMVVAGMEQREEWQVRKAATETLLLLVTTMVQQQQQQGEPAYCGPAALAAVAAVATPESGMGALAAALPQLLVAVEQHVRFDRIPQVRTAAAVLWQELQRLAPPPPPTVRTSTDVHHHRQQQQRQRLCGVTGTAAQGCPARQKAAPPPPCVPSRRASPQQSPPRFVRPQVPPEQGRSLDFGVQVFAPPVPEALPAQEEEEQQLLHPAGQASLLALPSTASQVLEGPHPHQPSVQQSVAAELTRGGRGSAQGHAAAVHHVLHPLFSLQLQAAPPAVNVRATAAARAGGVGTTGAAGLGSVEVRVEDLEHPLGPRLEVEVMGAGPGTSAAATYRYSLQGGRLLQHTQSGATPVEPAAATPPSATLSSAQALHSPPRAASPRPSPPTARAPPQPAACLLESQPGSPVQLGKLASSGLPSFSPDRAAGRSSEQIGMDSPGRRWAQGLRPLDAHAPLLHQPSDGGLPSRRRSLSPAARDELREGLWQASGSGAGDWGEEATTAWRSSRPVSPEVEPCFGSPPSHRPSSPSLAPPQRCESPPPFTPGTQQGAAGGGAQLPAKGPLTAMVTKALSRLHQLEELQEWSETVSAQLSGDGQGAAAASQAGSDASSVRQQLQGGRALRRSLAEPSLSAIPEASERSASSAQGPFGGMVAGQGRVVEEEEDDEDVLRLVALKQKLEVSMREVQARIAQAGSEGDSIPAAWPQTDQQQGRGRAGPEGRGESGASSPRYSGEGMGEAPGGGGRSWQLDNPLFSSSRPSTALSMQRPLSGGSAEVDLGAALAAQGLVARHQQGGYHDSFAAPARQSSLGRQASLGPSLSLGSEFAVAGRETEEEVRSFLRGSIQHNPGLQPAPAPPHQGRLSPSALAAAAAAAAAAGYDVKSSREGPLAAVGTGGRVERPPRPPSAAQRGRPGASAAGERKERPRWAHLQAGPHPTSAASSPPRAVLRGSIDLDAILDSCEGSEASAAASCDEEEEGGVPSSVYPYSPQGSPPGDAAAGGGIGGGRGGLECHPATADLQRLRVVSRPASPGVDESIEEAVRGSISQVLQSTFPDDALERLDRLRARLSPSSRSGSRSASPHRAPLLGPAASCASPPPPQRGAQFAPRPPSPLAPGLPISRRQAALLREVVGQQQGCPSQPRSAGSQPQRQRSTADIQGTLMEALDRHTREVEACYASRQAAELALLRRQCGENLGLLEQVLQHEGQVLKAASEAAARGEVQRFVEDVLPGLADVLASKELLARCFQLAE